MRYKQNNFDLEEHWKEQIYFLNTSATLFDQGSEIEAKRMATSLRILFHETSNSHSLLKQLNKQNFLLLSSSSLYTPSNLLSSWLLLKVGLSNNTLKYRPLTLDNSNRMFLMKFEDWWNEIIFDDKKNIYSRRDIILFVANQDGGAHIDPYFNSKYAELTKYNSLNWTDLSGNPAQNNPAYVAIRQIVYEVLASNFIYLSGGYTRKLCKNSQFEMRFLDKYTRFKWSSTDIDCSPETKDIINQYKKEHRKLYLQEYKNKNKFLCIL
ncbi:hypothetical protein GNF80_06180 [Clostridium perfringens]|nr:hypothetical protein [Clostridium perfringens]